MSREIRSVPQFLSAMKQSARSKKPTVVKFYFTWCGHCQHVAEPYEQMARALPQVKFLSVDIEGQSDLAQAFQVNSGPSFFILNDEGKLAGRVGGANLNQVALVLRNLLSK